jgi:hypothetical protein
MAYQNPTLFGVAYASRLFREVDTPSSFEALRRKTGTGGLDLKNPANGHAQALLEWLNKWGCRITKDSFPVISSKLAKWFRKWKPKLPHTNLVSLQEQHLDILADAYNELLDVDDFGSTSASKALFAVCPHSAMPWDAAIQAEFKLSGRARENYRDMLERSKDEAEILIADAARCGVTDPQNIPHEVGSPGRTLPRLLDEFHWITITRRHRIPACEELQQWAGWACRE